MGSCASNQPEKNGEVERIAREQQKKRTFKRQTLAKIKRETPHMWPMGESHTSTNHNFHHFEQWKSFYPVCVVCRSLCMRWLISPIRQYFLLDSSLRMQPVCLCGAHYFWPQCKPETELRAKMKIYYTGIVNCEGSRKKRVYYIQTLGWVNTMFSPSTTPDVGEFLLTACEYELFGMVKAYVYLAVRSFGRSSCSVFFSHRVITHRRNMKYLKANR